MSGNEARRPLDLATVAATAVVVFAVANVAHEIGGHAGTCAALGGRVEAFSALWQRCDVDALPSWVRRAEAAGGTVVAALVGTVALGAMPRLSGANRFAAWLLAAVTLMQAPGYFLLSGIAGIGDWAVVTDGVPLARPALAIVGGVGYWLCATAFLRPLRSIVGGGEDRASVSRRALWTAWVAGVVTHVVAGLFDPLGLELVLVSAVGASAGGASGLLWMSSVLRGAEHATGEAGSGVPRSRGWWVAAAVVAAGFFGVLGPSVTL